MSRPSKDTHFRRGRNNNLACLAVLAAFVLGGPLGAGQAKAQAPDTFAITAPFSPERFKPVVDALAARFGGVEFTYQQARSAQIAARLSARAQVDVDLVIMAAPDIAVAITNRGLATPLEISPLAVQSGSESSWRDELFAMAFDPAVILASDSSTTPVPTSRLDLAQALETSPALFQRVGIVNVGIDAVSYTLASQDSLRSPLYWRLAAAFGDSQARIFNTGAELVEALRDGEIDIAYNVPLSDVMSGDQSGFLVIVPRDYVLGLPWTLFVPETSRSNLGSAVAEYLLSEEGQAVVSGVLWEVNPPQNGLEIEDQKIALGPELLVFLDTIKRSNFLDAWFELVTAP